MWDGEGSVPVPYSLATSTISLPSGHSSLRPAAAPHPAQEALLQAEEVQVCGGHGVRGGKRTP